MNFQHRIEACFPLPAIFVCFCFTQTAAHQVSLKDIFNVISGPCCSIRRQQMNQLCESNVNSQTADDIYFTIQEERKDRQSACMLNRRRLCELLSCDHRSNVYRDSPAKETKRFCFYSRGSHPTENNEVSLRWQGQKVNLS